MIDPVTGGGIGAGLYLAKKTADGVQYLFGGLGDEVREALRRWGAVRLRNVGRVVEIADRKSDYDANPDGAVPMRVGFRILQDGSYSQEEMVLEYLGGVLASSRSVEAPAADVGNSYVAMIAALADDHLRLHYVLYRSMQFKLHGAEHNLWDRNEATASLNFFVPNDVLIETSLLGGEKPITDDPEELFGALDWLERDGLIDIVAAGSLEYFQNAIQYLAPKDIIEAMTTGGIITRPTALGASLYTWAFGKAGRVKEFFTTELQDFAISDLLVPDRATLFSR